MTYRAPQVFVLHLLSSPVPHCSLEKGIVLLTLSSVLDLSIKLLAWMVTAAAFFLFSLCLASLSARALRTTWSLDSGGFLVAP